MTRGIGGTKKRGSKVKVPCPECGKVVTKAGLVGHMAWKHGKDAKRPMLPSKARPLSETRRDAAFYASIKVDFERMHREEQTLANIKALFWRLRRVSEHKQGEAYMAEAMPLVKQYMAKHKVTEAELYDQLAEAKRDFEELLDIVTRLSESMRRNQAQRRTRLS